MKIAFIPPGGLGGFIAGLPLLQAVMRQNPGAKITCPLWPIDLALFAQQQGLCVNGYIDPAATWDLFVSARGVHPDHSRYAATKRLVGSINETDPTPVALQLLRTIQPGASAALPSLSVKPSASEPAGQIAIHINGTGKAWNQWEGALKGLAAKNAKVLLIGKGTEGTLGRRLAQRAGLTVAECWNQPLTVVASRLAGCSYYCGDDDGITHLAAALGLKGTAIWRNPIPNWRPPSPHFSFVTADAQASALLETLP